VRIDASKDEDGELSLFLKSPFVPLLTHPTGTPNNSNSGSTTPATNPHATNNTVTGGSGAGPPAALTPAEALRTVDLVFRARTKGGELLCFILFLVFFFDFVLCSRGRWRFWILEGVCLPPLDTVLGVASPSVKSLFHVLILLFLFSRIDASLAST
jgi:hypothetical protein